MANFIGNDNTLNLIKTGMSASNQRATTISNNIANVNTAGYKRKYVSFEESLNNAMTGIDMTKTNLRHLSDGSEGLIQIKEDTTTSMNENGNNVDIENEMLNLSTNALMYNALVSQLNTKYSIYNYVINK